RDIALGALQRLAPDIVRRNAVRVRSAELDVEAVHAVEADLQRRDAGALALLRLELVEEAARVLADRAQLVELRVVTFGDHAAVADEDRRRFDDRALQELALAIVRAAALGERLQTGRRIGQLEQTPLDLRQDGERVAKLREIARACGAERDARQHALEIADVGEELAKLLVGTRFVQRLDGVLPRDELGEIAHGAIEPAAQQSAAHAGRAAVHDPGERELGAPAEARLDLEIAPRRDVHDHRVVAALAREAAQMRHLRALRLLDVLHETAGRADRVRHVLGGEAREVADP